MHIADGLLPTYAWAAGYAAAGLAIAIDMGKLQDQRISRLALPASMFLVGSLVHIPKLRAGMGAT